ncbi:MAG: WD40/YVTN/BNR-like repeat-containing protein, partial [Melioribacteraceae bacterium]
DYVIEFSNDLGSTWTHQIPEPTLLINEEKTQDRIYSVLARGNNNVNALGMNGVYYTDNGGTNWTKCSSPGGDNWVIHGLAQSPKNSDHLFLSLYCNQAFLSTDGGHNWNNIT